MTVEVNSSPPIHQRRFGMGRLLEMARFQYYVFSKTFIIDERGGKHQCDYALPGSAGSVRVWGQTAPLCPRRRKSGAAGQRSLTRGARRRTGGPGAQAIARGGLQEQLASRR
ncbi:hypothetical protein SBA3_1450015 [Candidatus Sulfopaludibacter sp. SbA3]|nr:hypothetical protein SBA3_1450015 [Candidatus Sulfopaludibacter sp. SbA3]